MRYISSVFQQTAKPGDITKNLSQESNWIPSRERNYESCDSNHAKTCSFDSLINIFTIINGSSNLLLKFKKQRIFSLLLFSFVISKEWNSIISERSRPSWVPSTPSNEYTTSLTISYTPLCSNICFQTLFQNGNMELPCLN